MDTLRKATGEVSSQLHADPADIRHARFYRTPAYPAGSGPDFVNSAMAVVTRHSAGRILSVLHGVEAAFGRVRAGRWGARTLDLDLLAVDGEVAPDAATLRRWIDLPPERQRTETPDRLLLPHPRMQDRAFVLVPLADVAPDWTHPLLGLTVAQMLARQPAADRDAVVALPPET
ncbi:2-amino-4-hydroxy-6-hydroxymethyldihydropteridine pyrophosphokinase [Wenxinia marina]|nr:2-amino-4-hydroxy-6-hydroxymethyldihydropteridine pyrophosphokinase [Wenxinia marina]